MVVFGVRIPDSQTVKEQYIMSQEKVDKYKQEKANRKEIMKKEKMQHMIRRCVISVCGLALVAWLGYSAYNVYEANQPKDAVSVNYEAITDYQSELAATME